ncbi:MAG: glycosyltransferase [Dehalococcoidia bacterium]|nr:glycosyltransferase [Dehalococcoidia bacterium]
MKLAVLSVHSCPLGKLGGKDTGGMNVYVRELAGVLGRQGHTVDIFTHRHENQHPEIIELASNARLIHIKSGNGESVDKQTLYPYLADFVCNLDNFRKADGSSYDLIYSHYWLSGLVGKLLQSWWRVPHMTMFHTLGIVKNSLGIGEEESDLRIETERLLLNSSDSIVASTARERKIMCSEYGACGENIAIIPCGVNLELFKPVDKTSARKQLGIEGKVILFVGRIETIKGLDRLVEAISLLNIPDLKLYIVGGDGYSRDEINRLKALAEKIGVDKKVNFLEPVPQEQLPDYYSAADVFVLPSYHESFGMVALEALACGTPVIATGVGDLDTIIQPGVSGYIVPDNSAEHLAGALSLAFERHGFGTREVIRATVSGFSWERIARETLRECRKLGVLK